MKMKSWVLCKPLVDVCRFVRSIVFEDDVDVVLFLGLPVYRFQKCEELPGYVLFLALSNDLPACDIKRSK